MGDLKVCQYMSPHVDEVHDAKVLRVSPYGIEVWLNDFHISGFLPSRTIGERPKLEGATLQLRRGRKLFSFTEGYPIRIRIEGIDFLRLQVLFAMP